MSRLSDEYLRRMAPFGRMSLQRAIRLKCGECMGGEPGRLPLGEVATAVAECGSATCSLWPFRMGRNPWRPPPSEKQMAQAARLARDASGLGARSPSAAEDELGGIDLPDDPFSAADEPEEPENA
jgi:hypothetical protein